MTRLLGRFALALPALHCAWGRWPRAIRGLIRCWTELDWTDGLGE